MPQGITFSHVRPRVGEGVDFIFRPDAGGDISLTLPDEIYLEWQGRVGERISDEDFAYLEKESETYSAVLRGIDLLDFGDATVTSMTRKLRTKGFSPAAARRAAEILAERGLINELRFARRAVRYYLEKKNYGRSRIISEMYAKGFSRETVDEVMDGIPHETFIAACRAMIAKKYGGSLPTDPDGYRRAVSALFRYGFSRGEISLAVSEKE